MAKISVIAGWIQEIRPGLHYIVNRAGGASTFHASFTAAKAAIEQHIGATCRPELESGVTPKRWVVYRVSEAEIPK